MKKYLKVITLALAMTVLAGSMAACNNSGSSDNSASSAAAATTDTKSEPVADDGGDDGEDLGFTEVEIFSGVEKEFLNLNISKTASLIMILKFIKVLIIRKKLCKIRI